MGDQRLKELKQTPTLMSNHRVDISKFSLKDFLLRSFILKDDNYVLGQAPVVSKPPAQKSTVSSKPKSTPPTVTERSLKPVGKKSESTKGSGKKSDTTPKQSANSKTSSTVPAKNAEWPLGVKLALGGLSFLIILLLIIAISCCICGSSRKKIIMRPDLEMGLRIPQRLRAHPLSRHRRMSRRMMSSRRSSCRSRRSYY